EIYVDGELMGTKVDNTLGGIGVLSDLIIGNCDGYHNTPFAGTMDELRFYEGVLTSDAVYDLFADGATSIREANHFGKGQMLAHPNPFNEQLTLYIGGEGSDKLARVQMFNQAGVLVYSEQQTFTEKRLVLSGLEGLSSGIYVCVVRLGTELHSV